MKSLDFKNYIHSLYEGYIENVKNGTGKFAEHCFDWE